MMGQMINAAVFVAIVSIVVPFVFVVWVINKILSYRRERKQRDCYFSEDDELYKEMNNLNKRIDNIEIITKRKNKER